MSDEQLKPDELTVEADRVCDACLRAANVLEICSDIPYLPVGPASQILEAAVNEVQELRSLRDAQCRRDSMARLSFGNQLPAEVNVYHGGRWTPQREPLDSLLSNSRPAPSIPYVIDRLLMLAECLKNVGGLSGDRFLRPVHDWSEQPDWHELERHTVGIVKAAERFVKKFRNPTIPGNYGVVAAYGEEIAFRGTALAC